MNHLRTTTINAELAETFDAAPEAAARPADRVERFRRAVTRHTLRSSAVSAVTGVLLCLAFTTPAQAQSDFSLVNLKPGDFTYLTLPNGVEISGPLVALTPALISIDGRWFQPVPGLTIQRRGDSILNGAAWGLAGGLIAGTLSASGECGVDWSTGLCIAAGGLWGTAIGALYDVAYVGRTTVFRAPQFGSTRSFQMVPRVGAGSNALFVTLRF